MKAKCTGPDCASALPAKATASAAANKVFFIQSSLMDFPLDVSATLLRLVALGDDRIECRADTLARGLEPGEQPEGIRRLMDAQFAPGHQSAALRAGGLQKRRPERRVDRIRDPQPLVQQFDRHGTVAIGQ